jgi:hypothetical protein
MTELPDSAATAAEIALDDALPVGPGGLFTFIYYFSTAAFITALFSAKAFGVSVFTPLPWEVACIGGAIGGSLGVLFNRSQTLEVSDFSSQKVFRQELTTALSRLGYAFVSHDDSGTVACYQRPNASRVFSGDIYVQERDDAVLIVSRAQNIRALEKILDA